MACVTWQDKIDAYADGELSAAEMRAMGEHLRACSSCAADVLARVQMKRALQSAGKRFVPSAELRERIQKELRPARKPAWGWRWAPGIVALAVVIAIAMVSIRVDFARRQDQAFAELADLHVATLASAAPVDVISTDRHTVKPWFEGKIPFTFNLPELVNSPFTLEGGRVSYMHQSPGAQLIFRVGNHRISVFIFQNSAEPGFDAREITSRRLTFTEETWTEQGLRYFIVGDADPSDIHKLSELLRVAARA